MSKPIVFLDIDGVLNSEEYYTRVFEGEAQSVPTFPEVDFDPAAIAIVNRLANNFDFVITSSWRKSERYNITKILESLGFIGNVIGYTPSLQGKTRGHEVDAWLKESGDGRAYIILDDDKDFLPHQSFLHINPYTGITYDDVYYIKKKFKCTEHRMYTVTLRHLSGIQKGIQSLHAVVDYSREHNSPNYRKWADIDKTVVLLECNSSKQLGEIRQNLINLGTLVTEFTEPDVYDKTTAIAFMLDEGAYTPTLKCPISRKLREITRSLKLGTN